MSTKRKSVISAGKKSITRESSVSTSKDTKYDNFWASANEDTFSQVFRNYCVEFNSDIVPAVRTVPSKELRNESHSTFVTSLDEKNKENITTFPEVVVIESSKGKTKTNVIFKHMSVKKNMLIALKATLKIFNSIAVLKLEFCGLQATEIHSLQRLLKESPSITEISVNGNPNPYQNFYRLCRIKHLLSLSLRFCKIGDKGISAICDELRPFSAIMLTHLNLSSNLIGDKGMECVANALRENRNLAVLNLADNQITDKGCIMVMDVLQKFSLQLDELIVRRKNIMNGLKRGLNLKDINNKSSTTGASFSRHKSSCKTQRTESWPDNNITHIGLKAIVNALKYQISGIVPLRAGLSRLILEGNSTPNCSSEMNEILEALRIKNGSGSSELLDRLSM